MLSDPRAERPIQFVFTHRHITKFDPDIFGQVYSPWLRAWLPHLALSKSGEDPLAAAPPPTAIPASIRQHLLYGKLFDAPIPDAVEGFALEDAEERERIATCWPAGEDTAKQVSCMRTFSSISISSCQSLDP